MTTTTIPQIQFATLTIGATAQRMGIYINLSSE